MAAESPKSSSPQSVGIFESLSLGGVKNSPSSVVWALITRGCGGGASASAARKIIKKSQEKKFENSILGEPTLSIANWHAGFVDSIWCEYRPNNKPISQRSLAPYAPFVSLGGKH
jgi:hypothetical protein